MAQRIQLRRGTAAEWTEANPVLAVGEPGVETDTGKQKFGDGVTAWNARPYASKGDKGDQGAPGVADDTSVAQQVTNGTATKAALNATYLDKTLAGSTYVAQSAKGTKLMAIGDSITAAQTTGGSFTTPSTQAGDNYLTHLCAASGGRFTYGGVIAHAGNTTAQIRAEQLPGILALTGAARPQACIVFGGTNDANQGLPLSETAANLTYIADTLKANGIDPIMVMPTPNDTSNTVRKAQRTIAAWVAVFAGRRGYRCVDAYGPLANTTYPGDYKAGYADDLVHPSRKGHRALGQAMWEQLKNSAPVFTPYRPQADGDPIDGLAGQGGFWNDGNADGVGDGWTNGSQGTTFTRQTKAGVIGYTTKATGGQPYIEYAPWNSGNLPAVGSRIGVFCKLWQTGIEGTGKSMSVIVYAVSGTGVYTAIAAPALNIGTDVDGAQLWAECVIPAGTAGLRVTFNGDIAGAGTSEIGEVFAINLSALGMG